MGVKVGEKLIISGGARLEGEVTVSGAKNSALKLLAATLLSEDEIFLLNFPVALSDIEVHLEMLQILGKTIEKVSPSSVKITENRSLCTDLHYQGRSIRNTLLILGCLVGRFGQGRVPLPGGCKLGDRKFDLHVYVLQALGARFWEEGDMLCAEVPNGRLFGADIHLPLRSTGATENAILAGVLAEGVTRIWNPHIRPEIMDLIDLLKAMGAKIRVYGQEHIEVTGQDVLTGAVHSVIPDNMEAITWMVGASITNGDVEISNFPFKDLKVVLTHLEAAGANVFRCHDSAIIRGGSCYPLEISTGPHPGINSDVQPILAAWCAQTKGESKITDLRFPGRYAYAAEMAKMGMHTEVSGDMLILRGCRDELVGTDVVALDLRAGAALSLCALVASGESRITNAWQIQRGYENFVEKLCSLGADAKWSS